MSVVVDIRVERIFVMGVQAVIINIENSDYTRVIFSCIAEMLLVFGMSSSIQLLVSMLLFIHMTDLMRVSFCFLFEGKITLKFVGVLMPLNMVTCGSWISIISYSLLSLSFISSR